MPNLPTPLDAYRHCVTPYEVEALTDAALAAAAALGRCQAEGEDTEDAEIALLRAVCSLAVADPYAAEQWLGDIPHLVACARQGVPAVV